MKKKIKVLWISMCVSLSIGWLPQATRRWETSSEMYAKRETCFATNLATID